MARMNDGLSRASSRTCDIPDWALLPIEPRQEVADHREQMDLNWAPAGPGWFDSSWLLRQGLEVTELCSLNLLEDWLKALQTQSLPTENVRLLPA
ncbi:MAG: hypothetical protein ACKOF9_04490 [Burkholderiales bacterium]